MVVKVLAGLVYELIQNSWIFATILSKYFLISVGIKALREDSDFRETFQKDLLNYSPLFVSVLVLLGLLNFVLRLDVQPFSNPVSQIVALTYFGFLFWKY